MGKTVQFIPLLACEQIKKFWITANNFLSFYYHNEKTDETIRNPLFTAGSTDVLTNKTCDRRC